MTPTTKAALDAAEKALNVIKPYISRVAWDSISADALRLISEARKAEDWQPIETAPEWGSEPFMAIGRSSIHGGWHRTKFYRRDAAIMCGATLWMPIPPLPGPTTCTACDEPITGTVHYDVNQLPFDTDCYEDLCRAMASVPEGDR